MARVEDKLILIVEDEPDVRIFLQTILEDAGFKVMTAGDGEEGWEIIQHNKIDFVSLDLVLPRKSGHKLLKEIRQHHEYASIPVLIVTAHAKDDLGKTMMESIFGSTALLGPGLYLEKPVNPARYVQCVKQALGIESEDTEEPSVRENLRDLIRDADLETLNRVMNALKKEE